MIPLKSPKICPWKKTFLSLEFRISKNILLIGEAKVHTLSESKSILTIEQKAIVSCFVKHVAFLLGHPAVLREFKYALDK